MVFFFLVQHLKHTVFVGHRRMQTPGDSPKAMKTMHMVR